MTANPARLLVRDLFRAVTGWNVIAAARTPDAVLKPTALIWTSKLDRTVYGAGALVTSSVDVWLLTPKQDDPEDSLDQMLTTAIEAIEDVESLTWSEATRASLDGTWHGWHIVLTVTHQLTKE